MPSRRTWGIIPVSWFYREGRANALGRAFSRFWAWWASLGLPPRRQVGLEVRGRRTGRPHRIAVVVATHEGGQYLVSMVGEKEWVKNVRAADGEVIIISGGRRRARLEDVPVGRRAPIIREYARLAPGGRVHLGLGGRPSLEECERVAPGHPVFRVVYRDEGG